MNTANDRALTVTSLDTGRSGILQRISAAAALIAIAIGVLALLGWATDTRWLWQPIDSVRGIKANTAIGVILLGWSLWLIHDPAVSDERRAWAHFLAQIVVAGALITLAEYIADTNLGIDSIFDDPTGDEFPGRPAPHTVIAVLTLGLWLSVIDRPGAGWNRIENTLAAASGLVVLTAVVGWLYGADYVFGLEESRDVAPQTIAAILVLWLGTIVARPRGSLMRLVSSPGPGGHTIRRLTPSLVVIPILCGAVVIVGVEAGSFTLRVGAAAVVAAAIIAFLAVSVLTARELESLDDERRRLEEKLTDLADRDPLTGVFNRRRLDEELRRQISLAQRRGTPLAVLEIDLDRFKAANDMHGHATGDELLVATAEALRADLRESDFICRPGGDEFIVLLPDTDKEAARIVAGKLVRALRAQKRPGVDGKVVEFSASIGIATTDIGGFVEPVDLLAAADRALYAAKQAGGDRLAVDEDLVLD